MKVFKDGQKNKRDAYIKVTTDCKAKIAKYPLENVNCAAARKYSNEIKEKVLFVVGS